MDVFRKSPRDDLVESYLNGQYVLTPGIWPIIDENLNQTPFVVFGATHGMPIDSANTFKLLRSTYGDRFKYIYGSRRGSHFLEQYADACNAFDGIFDLDYNPGLFKSLRCNFAMMERSMPLGDFFWEPTYRQQHYDFSILSWGEVEKKGDKSAKRWDRAIRIIDRLCSEGLRGIVVLHRENLAASIPVELLPYVHRKLVRFSSASMDLRRFHELMCESRYTIFPNQVDAFPKFMIESLLANRPILVSKDLLHGLSVLDPLGCVFSMDFTDPDCLSTVADIVRQRYGGISPRERWIEMHSLPKLSSIWAQEFNRVFSTSYQNLYFLHHIDRVRAYHKRVSL